MGDHADSLPKRFAELHSAGCFVMPNAWDVGSARILATLAFETLATSEVARAAALVLTARAENHLYGAGDLEDTIARLAAYRQTGADVVYAPGLVDIDQIARVVRETGAPVNVLARVDGPGVDQLRRVGVRRVSTGGTLAFAAYGALAEAGRELLGSGTSTYDARALSIDDRRAAFGG